MIKKYKEYYKLFGLRTMQSFVRSRIGKIEELRFPINSTVHHLSYDRNSLSPDQRHPYYDYSFKVPVVCMFDLKDPIGGVRKNSKLPKTLMREMKKDNKNFKYMLSGSGVTATGLHPIIYNYDGIQAKYKYTANMLNDYYEWRNLTSSLILNVKHNPTIEKRHQFIFMNVPTTIPKVSVLDMHVGKVTSKALKEFPTPEHLTLLDLWAWFDSKLKHTSVLGHLELEELKNTTIILKSNSSWMLVNLGTLSEMNKSHGKAKGNQLDHKKLRRLFLVLLIRMNKTSLLSDTVSGVIGGDDAQEDDSGDIKNLSIDNILKESEAILNSNMAGVVGEEHTEHKETIEIKDLDISDDTVAPLKEEIDSMQFDGYITKREKDKLTEIITSQEKLKSPYNNGLTLIENMTVSKEDLVITDDVPVTDSDLIPDKTMLKSSISSLDETYVEKVLQKDKLSVIYAMQKAGIVITDHEIETTSSLLGDIEVHKIKVKPLLGKASTIVIRLPKVDSENNFKIAGSKYKMIKSRVDKPIRKTRYNRVSLSSYAGKLFIDKTGKKKDDAGYAISKFLIKDYISSDPKISDLVTVPTLEYKWPVHNNYSVIARYTRSFKVNGIKFFFDYNTRHTIYTEPLKDIEKNGRVLVGVKGSIPVIMEENGSIVLLSKEEKKLPTILEQIGLDESALPVEFATIKIFSKSIPLVYLSMWYHGLSKLLKMMDVDYELLDIGKRVDAKEFFTIKFKDKKITIPRKDKKSLMLLGGLKEFKEVRDFNFYDFDNNSVISSILLSSKIPSMYIKEISILDKLFIDPMTKEVLIEMKEPETFRGLLFRSIELLLEDKYNYQQDMTEMLVKGYERIPGMMYKRLVSSVRDFENKNAFSKAKVDMNPYAVWQDISTDSLTMLVDDLNPIASLKQREDLSYLGNRSKESMSKSTRMYHESDIGVVSEGAKDSGDVGISMYMSANPKIANVRGAKDPKVDISKTDITSRLSTSALLAPGSMHDEPVRVNFAGIQNSHVVPVSGATQPYVRTGYESVLPYRLGKDFISLAKKSGIVSSITSNKMKVTYTDGKKETFKIGMKSTKIESNVSYAHDLVTDMVKGKTFKENDILVYNSSFFEIDFFDPSKIVYKAATNVVTAFFEMEETDEDSCTISTDTANDVVTTTYKVKSFIIDNDQELSDLLTIGTKVSHDDKLFTMRDKSITNTELDKKTLAMLSDIKSRSPKAKANGVIGKIELVYNSELDDMSTSLATLAKKSDKERGMSGKVTSEYSIQGKALIDGTVEMKIFILVKQPMGTGDKGIFGNQLKTTVASVYNTEITTQDGTIVGGCFGEKSVQARVVESSKIVGTTATLLDIIADKAVELYDQ